MKKFRIRFINEGSLMQPATVSGNTTQEEMNKDTETEQMEQDQENSVVANSAPTLTPQQVEDMSDGEVLTNFYLNPTSDLPEDAYQALQNRAGDFANKVRVGNVTPDEMKKTSNAIAANNAKIQNPIGESTDWMVSHIENVLLGKKGEKGRMGAFVWNGKDLYEETDEEDNGRTHYWNEWVGSFDRPSKTIYLNPDASTMVWNRIITAGRNLKWNLKKTQNRKPRVDMGFEGDDDPLFAEAYSSGRVDTFDEPYYGGGESDWGIDEEDSTYRSPYHTPSKEHEEFMRGEDSQRIDLLSELKEAVSDRIDDLTDGEIDADDVYDFVSDYIDNAHKKYTIEELKKFSKIYTGKVDFFAKTILAKYKKRNGKEEQEERFLSDEDIVDIKRELVNKVANELDDEFGYEIDKFDIDVHYFVGVFLKDNPNVFGKVLSKKNSDDWYISGADVQSVLKEALPSFRRKIAFMKKFGK